MHFEQLEYILEVAKAGSISGAAQNMHVSITTISQSVSNFEAKYDVRLFNRSRTGTIPTDQGKLIIEKIYEIKNKLKELEYAAKPHIAAIDKELKIVSSPSVLLTFLPPALSAFQKLYPHIPVKVEQQSDVMEIIKQNKTDLAFISVNEITWIQWGNQLKEHLHFDTLCQGRMSVCVSKNSPLAFKDSISPEELLEHKFAMFSDTKLIYEDIAKQYGPLSILLETKNTEIIKKLVREGVAITFMSDLIIKSDPNMLNEDIKAIPLVNYEQANVTYGWVRSKRRPFSSAARDLLKIMRTQIENA